MGQTVGPVRRVSNNKRCVAWRTSKRLEAENKDIFEEGFFFFLPQERKQTGQTGIYGEITVNADRFV